VQARWRLSLPAQLHWRCHLVLAHCLQRALQRQQGQAVQQRHLQPQAQAVAALQHIQSLLLAQA
jgi:hypothetical protein